MTNFGEHYSHACADWPLPLRLFGATVVIYVISVIIMIMAETDFLVALGGATALVTGATAIERFLVRRRVA